VQRRQGELGEIDQIGLDIGRRKIHCAIPPGFGMQDSGTGLDPIVG
jgi:hypothetical protein